MAERVNPAACPHCRRNTGVLYTASGQGALVDIAEFDSELGWIVRPHACTAGFRRAARAVRAGILTAETAEFTEKSDNRNQGDRQ